MRWCPAADALGRTAALPILCRLTSPIRNPTAVRRLHGPRRWCWMPPWCGPVARRLHSTAAGGEDVPGSRWHREGPDLETMRQQERVHASVLEHIPIQGIAVTALARELPDTLMEEAFPKGLLRFLQAHPQNYLLSSVGSGVLVKRFLQQRSSVVRGGPVSPGTSGRWSSAVEPSTSRVSPTGQPLEAPTPIGSVLPFSSLWGLYSHCRGPLGSSTECRGEVVQFLHSLTQHSGRLQLFCLVEQLSAPVGTHDVLEAFQMWEAELCLETDLKTMPLTDPLVQFVSRTFPSPPSDEGEVFPQPLIGTVPPSFQKSSTRAGGNVYTYRHSFFLRTSGKSLSSVQDVVIRSAQRSTLTSVPRDTMAAQRDQTRVQLQEGRAFANTLDWDAVLDYEAFRLCPYLRTLEPTPLAAFFPTGSEQPTSTAVVSGSLTKPLARTLAVFTTLQEYGDVPYTRHKPDTGCPEPTLKSIFAWNTVPESGGAAVGVESGPKRSGWVTGVRFALDEPACLPVECFRTWTEVNEELTAVQHELKEVRRLRRCGAFQRRLFLTNRRRHLLICSAILSDPEKYAVYHGDVLAYYLFDRLPSTFEPGGEWRAVFLYNNLAGLLPAPLDRRALVSSLMLRNYPHLFVPFILQGQRVVVRRDVFESVRHSHIERQMQLRRGTEADLPEWLRSSTSPSLTATAAESLAPNLFDPAMRIQSAGELAQYLAQLIALRKGRKRKYAGSYPCSLESLREMLPRHFSTMLRHFELNSKTAIKESKSGKPGSASPISAPPTPSGLSRKQAVQSTTPSPTSDPNFLRFLLQYPHVFRVREDTYVELAPELETHASQSSPAAAEEDEGKSVSDAGGSKNIF